VRIAYAVLATVSLSLTLMAADSFEGTWKLNLAKSKLQCSDTVSQTMKITGSSPNSQRTMSDIVSKSGAHHQRKRYHIFDGKEHPLEGEKGATEISQRVDASTAKSIFKRDGKVVGETTATVSGDVLTNHSVFGKCEDTLIFEKQ
jgi:hypothetical protein